MIKAEPDQFLGDRKRDKSLRRLPRDIELFGDLVLRIASDVVEPGCPRREIELTFLSLCPGYVQQVSPLP
jgi:hypothetical protein